MDLPDEPIYCEICKKNSINLSKVKQEDGHYEFTGLFTLPTHKIEDKERRFHPITGLCGGCGQVKIFFKFDGIITGDKAKEFDDKFGIEHGAIGIEHNPK